MAKSTLSFVCQNCGAAYNRWQGKCDSCGEWNTLAEEDTTGSVPVSIRRLILPLASATVARAATAAERTVSEGATRVFAMAGI